MFLPSLLLLAFLYQILFGNLFSKSIRCEILCYNRESISGVMNSPISCSSSNSKNDTSGDSAFQKNIANLYHSRRKLATLMGEKQKVLRSFRKYFLSLKGKKQRGNGRIINYFQIDNMLILFTMCSINSLDKYQSI